jgi:hypothetical protein
LQHEPHYQATESSRGVNVMYVTIKETVTRFHTIEVDDEYKGCDSSELECDEIREAMFDDIDMNGWSHEFVHEVTFFEGEALDADTIFYKG